VTTVGVGDRVVVHPGNDELGRIGSGGEQGGLTPLLLVREAARGGRLFPVPADLPLETAAFAEPLAVGMHSVDQAEVQAGESVAVFGCGPIGLAAIATLVDRGHDAIVAVDMSPTRLNLARELGAQAALHAADDDVWAELARVHGSKPSLLGPTPATDVFIEASGSPRVIKDVLDRGPVGGRMVVVALHYGDIPISFVMMLMKEFTLRGAMEYPDRFENAIELLARRDLSALITHRLPLDAFDAALGILDESKDCGKVLITIDATS
jgi:(R,R)-butanediol dehydrogenase / meso-butanediol dehydrogenase / diacetyl reductase